MSCQVEGFLPKWLIIRAVWVQQWTWAWWNFRGGLFRRVKRYDHTLRSYLARMIKIFSPSLFFFRSSLTCPHCLKQSNTFDPFLCISLPIPLRQTRWRINQIAKSIFISPAIFKLLIFFLFLWILVFRSPLHTCLIFSLFFPPTVA